MRFLVAAFLILSGIGWAQEGPSVTEVKECENGTFGDLNLSDNGSSITASARFWKQKDCDSKVATLAVRPGACTVVSWAAQAPADPEDTPSTVAPQLQSLDAGKAVTIVGPRGTVPLARTVNQGLTAYDFSLEAGGFLTAGKYKISFGEGRDFKAFEAEIDYEPLAVTSPARGVSLRGNQPPEVSWTGGNREAPTTVVWSLQGNDGRQGYDVTCQLADGQAGRFSVPSEIWSQVPASVRTASVGTVYVYATAPNKTIPVPELELGLRVTFFQFGASIVRLVP